MSNATDIDADHFARLPVSRRVTSALRRVTTLSPISHLIFNVKNDVGVKPVKSFDALPQPLLVAVACCNISDILGRHYLL
jgi:hypothetical protein